MFLSPDKLNSSPNQKVEVLYCSKSNVALVVINCMTKTSPGITDSFCNEQHNVPGYTITNINALQLWK